MIRRVEDFSSLSNKDLNRLAEVVKKTESSKEFDIFETEEQANISASELKIKGFKTEIVKMSENKFKLIASLNDSIPLNTAEESGSFKKLAWGRYCFERQSAIGMFDFNFNDGTIWKLSKDENGNDILVKEVEDENEDEVIRSPQNGVAKFASSEKLSLVNEKNFDSAVEIVFGTSCPEWNKTILSTEAKQSVIKKLNQKFEEVVSQKLVNLNIVDDNETQEIKGLISTALSKEIKSDSSLDNFLHEFKKKSDEKAGKQRKYFN